MTGTTSARKRVLLVLGRRGPGLDVTLAGLRSVADVTCAATRDVAAARIDGGQLGTLPAQDVVLADTPAELLDAVADAAARHPIDGVLTVADDTVELAARLAHRLGVRGLDPDAVGVFRDKRRQRAALAAAGLTVPRWWTAREALAEADLPYPVIVKPTRASGGALVFVVASRDELIAATALGADQIAGHGAVDDGSDFLVEELIPGAGRHPVAGFGPYVSVESATVDGRRVHLGVTDRFPVRAPVLETGMCLPSTLTDTTDVLDLVDTALDALGLDQGLSHTEVMLTADGPVVIEVNARMGGALPYLFPLAAGLDLFAVAAACALGRPAAPVTFARHAVFTALQHPLGVEVVREPDLSALSQVTGVRTVVPLAGSGHSTLDLRETMAALVLGVADDAQAVVAQHAACRDAFRPGYRAPTSTPAYLRRTPDGRVEAWEDLVAPPP